MKKIFTNILVTVSVLLAVYAVFNTGVLFFQSLIDLLGYVIYVSVFAAPAVYFYRKMNA